MRIVDIITGTRPNFMKVAPLIKALQEDLNKGGNIAYRLIHTGQHANPEMSRIFWEELHIPRPDINLEVSYCSSLDEHRDAIMHQYETVLMQQKPDMVIVVGDCTSTLACAQAAKNVSKDILLAHVEAGLRCRDNDMPEEYNRIMTDQLSDYFFTTTIFANQNLEREGIPAERIFFVGNTMIDTLHAQLPAFKRPVLADTLQLREKEYFVLTMHRRANILSPGAAKEMIRHIVNGASGRPVVFPIHPHTAQKLNIDECVYPNLHIVNPMGYLEFNYLVQHAQAVITDSGGITEEATVLNVPCMTLRDCTERPETCLVGSNELIGTTEDRILPAFEKLFSGNWKTGTAPQLWDGMTSRRIVGILNEVVFPASADHKAVTAGSSAVND